MFSLVNKTNKPFMAKYSEDKNRISAIYCYAPGGPAFGVNTDHKWVHDIFIAPNSNDNHESHSNFWYSFQHHEFEKETTEAQTIIAGEFNFKTVEVFVKAEINK